MTVIELSRSPKRGSVPTIERQKGVVVVGDGTLDPVIQSTLGVVREAPVYSITSPDLAPRWYRARKYPDQNAA
jgi:hypothetical protein